MNFTNEDQNSNNIQNSSFVPSIIKLMRPKQWIKNLFVLGPLIFSISFLEPRKIGLSLIAFVLFCLISSTVYIMNDIVDVEKDRIHPKKKTDL